MPPDVATGQMAGLRRWLPSSQASQDLPIQQILPSVLEHCKSSSADLVLQVESDVVRRIDQKWTMRPEVMGSMVAK